MLPISALAQEKPVLHLPFTGGFADVGGKSAVNHGGILTYDRFGTPDAACALNGKSWLAFPAVSALDFGTDQSFSISVWIRACSEQKNFAGIVTKQVPTATSPYVWPGFQISVVQGTNIEAAFETKDQRVLLKSGPNVTDGNWHQIVMVTDRSKRSVSLHIDGKQVEIRNSIATRESVNRLDSLFIGKERNSKVFFNGIVDDLMIFGRAIDASEISRLYHDRGWDTPSPNLGDLVTPAGPVTICSGESAVLTAPPGFDSYTWSTGATTPTITVRESGAYSVTLSSKNEICPIRSLPVTVEVLGLPKPTVVGPATACVGDSIVLSVAEDFPWYAWSTGDTSRTIVVDKPGRYAVMVMSEKGCIGTSVLDVMEKEPGRTARIGVAQEIHIRRGDPAAIPVTLDEPLDEEAVDALNIDLRYNEAVMKIFDVTAGILLDGWTLERSRPEPGRYRIRATAPAGASLKGKGTLLILNAYGELEGPGGGDLDITLSTVAARCSDPAGARGQVILQLPSGVTGERESHGITLKEAYPNPFNHTTDIGFTLETAAHVTLTIHDDNGDRVVRLLDERTEPGTHTLRWTPENVPSGFYFVRMTAGSTTLTSTLIYLE